MYRISRYFVLLLMLLPVLVSAESNTRIEVTIGAGNILHNLPLYFNFNTSLYQTLYYASEINTTGSITGLALFNNFTSSLMSQPTRIWLGTTELANLSGDWIPSGEMTQVFDGLVDYPLGENYVTIWFDNPFEYNADNLVLLVHRPMDTQSYSAQNRFQCQTIGSNRSRTAMSFNQELDPANPPTPGFPQLSGTFPKTTLFIQTGANVPEFQIQPGSHSFGEVIQGTLQQQVFQITNTGVGTLILEDISLSGHPYFALSQAYAPPCSLESGQRAFFTVVYSPLEVGEHAASISIQDNLQRIIHTIPVSGTAIDPTIYSLPYAQDFDLATPPHLPSGWSFIAEPAGETPFVRVVADANSPSLPNCIRMQGSSVTTGNIFLIAPPLAEGIPVSSTSISFWAQLFPFPLPNSVSVGVMTDPTNPASYVELQNIMVSESEWLQYQVPFHSYQGSGRFIAFKHPQQWEHISIKLDSIQIESLADHDLATISLTGEQYPVVGTTCEYYVTIGNYGTQAQDNYQIVLLREPEIELASIPGPYIAPNQSISVNIFWTPDTIEILHLTARIDFTADSNPENNSSQPLRVNVQSIGTIAFMIGEGDLQAWIPFNMYRLNSLYQTIYYADEIGHRGWISGLELYNDFASIAPLYKHTSIWLGETQQTDLIQGWICSSELNLVYDDIVCFPPGQNAIYIEFDPPFLYQGTNLLMLAHRPFDTQYHSSSDFFRCQDSAVSRSRRASSDAIVFDPSAPPLPAQIQLSGLYPQSTFFINSTGLGSIQGTVINMQNQPIEGAVIIAGSQQTVTDSAGSYLLLLPPGIYDITVSASSYMPATEQAIAVLEGQYTILNFTLGPLSTEDPMPPPGKPVITCISPNPFARQTLISYRSISSDQLTLQIHNLKGQLVKTFSLISDNGGKQAIIWDGTSEKGLECANGIYFIRLKLLNETVSSRKISLIK